MKRVLIVTHSFPPLLEARSIQIAKIVRHLRRFGWDPVVLTVEPRYTPINQDASLPTLLPDDIQIVRTAAFEPQWAISLLARTVPSALYLPDKQIGWLPFAVRAASGLSRREPFDLIFTNAKPFTCHLVGQALKRRCALPWVAYFSDPWVDNAYFQRISRGQVRRNRRMETRTLSEADGLVFNNPETVRLMLPAGAEAAQALVLPHCYDPSLFDLATGRGRGSGSAPSPEGTVRIVHTGNFYGVRSPLPLLDALDIGHGDSLPPVEVLLVGKIDEIHRRAIERHRVFPCVRLTGSVGYLESLAHIQSAQLLVTIDAPVGDQSVFFPSKLADYLGSGKPVLGVTPPGSTTARILSEHGQYVADVSHPAQIRQVIREAIEQESGPPPPPAYEVTEVVQQLASYFDRISAASHP